MRLQRAKEERAELDELIEATIRSYGTVTFLNYWEDEL